MAATTLELVAFVLFAAVTVGASLAVVLVRDVWHAALLLGVALLSVAVHFVMLRAEFLAAMQILVYVGGVLILISFAVMLVRRPADDPTLVTSPQLNLGGHLWRGLGAVALFAVLAAVTARATFGAGAGFPADANITASIGYALIGLEQLAAHPVDSFLVALIVIAVVLDAALDGSILLARREEEDE
ncbi:MAG: NADH-quinone oxidoreductase subunit J [Halobacteriales archaeon]|nr:NADH-quinone oxidoreductase subunit J [Halobacteriales archaeon]